MTDTRPWLGPVLLGVGLITLARVVLLAFNKTDLFVDEAQYWLWGQDLAFGYYSKPPMIGWVIRLATEIGTDAQFWVRLPAPLFHGVTAIILAAIAAQLAGRRAALLVALAYVTLPMVAVGSLLISTDTIMFPFLALALLGYFRLTGGYSIYWSALTGVALGLAFSSKYAAIYYIMCAVLVAVLVPRQRITTRNALMVLVAFLAAASPNLIWNIANGLTTVEHTLDNADWVRDPGARAGLNFAGLGEFFGAQFVVFGPVLFGAFLIMAALWRRATDQIRTLILFSAPIIVLVCVQALLSKAYANWAAAAYLAGVLLVVPWLMGKSRLWLIASFTINGALCLLFPIATTVPYALSSGGQPLLNRYILRADVSRQILQIAEDEGVDVIVARDRDVLADLFYTGRDSGKRIYSLPFEGRAPHHYAQNFSYPGGDERVIYVGSRNAVGPCAAAISVADIEPEIGAFRKHHLTVYVAPGGCVEPR